MARIARGSGTSIKEVNELLMQFKQFEKVVGKMKVLSLIFHLNSHFRVSSPFSGFISLKQCSRLGLEARSQYGCATTPEHGAASLAKTDGWCRRSSGYDATDGQELPLKHIFARTLTTLTCCKYLIIIFFFLMTGISFTSRILGFAI